LGTMEALVSTLAMLILSDDRPLILWLSVTVKVIVTTSPETAVTLPA
jgi:hypothetical protein